jgi:multicomponent Na+:H+ antiporter subunit G
MNEILISFLLLAGSFFMLVSAIGMLRFKDLYSRLHAGAKAGSFALLLIIAGATLFFNSPVVYLKGVFIVVFVYLTAPLAAHTIVKSMQGQSQEKKETTNKK